MSKLIILLLIIVWTIFLLPDIARVLSRTRRSDSIRSFSTQLSSLGRANGNGRDDNVIDLRTRSSLNAPRRIVERSESMPATPQLKPRPAGGQARDQRTVPRQAASSRQVSPAVRKRRQDVLITLGSSALLTLLAAVAFGGFFVVLHVLVDLLLVAYLVLLAQVMSIVPATSVGRPRQQPLAPLSPLDSLRGDTVGLPLPVERQIAN